MESISLKLAAIYLRKEVEVVIDRPLGSKHPKHGFVYEMNYGGIFPIRKRPTEKNWMSMFSVKGKCIAIIHHLNDDDDKLVVVSKLNENISDEKIWNATHFQEQFFQSEIVR